MSNIPIRLRPQLSFAPVRSKDSVSYVVEDRIQQKYWKIGELEYEICSTIDGTLPAADVIKMLQACSPHARRVGVEKTHKILVWLLQSGLAEERELDSLGNPTSPSKLPPTQKPTKLFDPSSFRIPVLSSDALESITRWFTWMISLPCLLIAVATWGIAIMMVVQNNQDLMSVGQKLFVPGSQWWWLLAWTLLKAVHEAGHAIACTRAGAKSNGLGIGFIFFAPMPYVDVTNLWQVENKWKRAMVSAAGMLFELTFAALAVILACCTDNTGIRYLCFSIATLGTFTTLAFNGNPLMRYDGYYIFVDLVGRPNLWQDATKAMKLFFASWIYKDTGNRYWSVLMLAYGFASWVSRMLLLITMAWGMWMTWDGLGLVVVSFFVCLWFILPPIMRIRAASKQAKPWSWKNTFTSLCPYKLARGSAIVGVLGICTLLPSPVQISWPAIVDYVEPSDVRIIAPGFVSEVLVLDGQGVRKGDEVLRLTNPALEQEYLTAQSVLNASEEKCSTLRAQRKHSELQAEESICESLLIKSNILKAQVESLVIRAPRSGVLLARMSHNLPGSFIPEGQPIGIIVDPAQVEVKASVPQDAWELVAHSIRSPVAIHMFHGQRLSGKVIETLPRTSDTLDSPCLGGLYGGPITVVLSKDAKGEEQLKTDTPRLQTRIELDRSSITAMPPPGSLCSVKLSSQSEAIWQTGYRWIKAAMHVQFKSAS